MFHRSKISLDKCDYVTYNSDIETTESEVKQMSEKGKRILEIIEKAVPGMSEQEKDRFLLGTSAACVKR